MKTCNFILIDQAKQWDKNWKYEEIIEIGNMFSIDIMSEKYVNWYKEVMA